MLASYGNNRATVPNWTNLVITPCLACVFARRKIDAGEANYLASVLDGDVGCDQLLDLTPCPEVDSGVQTADRSYACVVEFDNRRWFGWHRDRREIRLAKDATCSFRECRSPFPLIQIDGPLGSGACTRSIAGSAQNRCQR